MAIEGLLACCDLIGLWMENGHGLCAPVGCWVRGGAQWSQPCEWLWPRHPCWQCDQTNQLELEHGRPPGAGLAFIT